jgi:NADPH-dependent 2,4-dienoyl-CoA reductase/sulfur reductase-like enzyme
MSDLSSYPYIIIGSGAAGTAAVEGIRRVDPNGAILTISSESKRFYSKPGLAYWLTGQIPEKQLYPTPPFDDRKFAVVRKHTPVVRLDPQAQMLELESGEIFSYQRLLIATGAQAIRPKIEGIYLNGVVTLDTFADAKSMLKQVRRAKRAVVVGGGITALEIAEGLAARGLETHYLLRKDRYWGNVLDEQESRMVEARLREEGIQIHYQAEIEKILANRKWVEAVLLRSGETIPCEMVGVAIGIRPNIQLVKDTEIRVERGILVDETLQTSVEGIYAAGDVAQVWDPLAGQYVLDSLWWIARQQGYTAGMNMAGEKRAYERQIPFNVTRIGQITTTIIGQLGQGETDDDLISIARGDSEIWRTRREAHAVRKDGQDNRVRLLIGEHTIHGALVMGDQALSRPLQSLISQQVDISPIRERLLKQPEGMTETIQAFWEQISHAG